MAVVTKNVRKWLSSKCKWQQEQTPSLLPASMVTMLLEESTNEVTDEDWFPISMTITPTLAPNGMPNRGSSVLFTNAPAPACLISHITTVP
jgi:hypothetical protein